MADFDSSDVDMVIVPDKRQLLQRASSEVSTDLEGKFQAFQKNLKKPSTPTFDRRAGREEMRSPSMPRQRMLHEGSRQREPAQVPERESTRRRPAEAEARGRPQRESSFRRPAEAEARGRSEREAVAHSDRRSRGRSAPAAPSSSSRKEHPRASSEPARGKSCTVCGEVIEPWEELFKWYCEHKDCGLAKRACERYVRRNQECVSTLLSHS